MTSGVLTEQSFWKYSCLCLCQRHMDRFSPRVFASCRPKKMTLKTFRSSCQLLSSTLEELQCRECVGNWQTSGWVSLDLVKLVRREPFCNSLFPAHLQEHWGSTLLLEETDSVPAVWGILRVLGKEILSLFYSFVPEWRYGNCNKTPKELCSWEKGMLWPGTSAS